MRPDPSRVASRFLSPPTASQGAALELRVEEVKMDFHTVDEWHSTNLHVTLRYTGTGTPSDDVVKDWLRDHWREVVSQAPWKPPAPAPDYSAYSQGSYGGWDDEDDDDGDDGDTSELPEPGLGWMNPHHETLRTAEEVKVKHPRAGVIQVDFGWSHR